MSLIDLILGPKMPHIGLDSVCPACGNRGCKLEYDPEAKNVRRICQTCGCIAVQLPVAPHLFKK